MMYKVAQRPDFKSALRVVKRFITPKVIYIYGLQCAFMQKKSKETNKKSKSLIFYVNWLKLGQLKSLYLDYDSFQLGKIFVVKPG